MNINALSSNGLNGYRPNQNFGANPLAPAGNLQQGGFNQDGTGLSREAQQAAGAQGAGRNGGSQQLTAALSRDINGVLQAQTAGDQNRGQQALQQLGQTYQQGQQSGMLQQVNPAVRGTAESLLGINKGEEGKGGGGGGGGPKEAGGGEEGRRSRKGERAKDKPYDEEMLKKLEELLGKDKADKAKEDCKECDKHKKHDDKDAKTDTKPGETKAHSVADHKKTDKVGETKPVKTAAAKTPKTTVKKSGGGAKKTKAA